MLHSGGFAMTPAINQSASKQTKIFQIKNTYAYERSNCSSMANFAIDFSGSKDSKRLDTNDYDTVVLISRVCIMRSPGKIQKLDLCIPFADSESRLQFHYRTFSG